MKNIMTHRDEIIDVKLKQAQYGFDTASPLSVSFFVLI